MSLAPPPAAGRSEGPGPLPRVFGRYVLFDRIGRGGMADIYLSRADTSLGGSRLCVVKQILADFGRDPQFERLLVEEAKLAARLTHANVVQVFDLGREGDRLFIGMEYVEGFDLNQLLRALSKAKVALPAEFALFVIREVLRALDYAHRTKDAEGRMLGLVHRDVSPSNVLISFEGEVKLCDFGIARALSAHEEGAPDAAQGAPRVVGKSAYMAPEHARGEPIDARADVFAAGILLWELCAGRRLYRGSEEEMLGQAQHAKVTPLPERGLPDQPRLQGVLDRALARYRDDRYQSAHEFLRALEDYAMSAKLMASQLRFGTFLTDHFAKEIVELRRERELAARGLPSEIPPPSSVDEEESPTTVADGAALLEPVETDLPEPSVVLGRIEKSPRIWTEPGAIDPIPRALDSGKIALKEPGIEDTRSVLSRATSAAEDIELDRSLMGLQLLADETQADLLRGTQLSQPAPSAAPSREWVWYAMAALILALGVAGYLWK